MVGFLQIDANPGDSVGLLRSDRSIQWLLVAAAAGGAVTSFNGRVGAVLPASGDYAASQVNNDSAVAGLTVKDALNTLAASVGGVASWNGRVGAVVPANGDYTSSQVTNASGVTGATVSAALDTLNAALTGFVPTTRTLTTTTPLQIGGGASADLSANRTLSILAVSNTTAGVVPQVPGTVGLALTSTAIATAWGVDFGANNPTTTGGWISATAAGAGFFRVGLAPGSGAGSGSNTGSFRLPNGTFVGTVYGRNAADNADIFVLGWNSAGLDTQVGSNQSGGNNTVTASAVSSFRVRLTTSATVVMSLTTTALVFSGINAVNFDPAPTVTISQQGFAGAGKQFTIIAQAGTTTGGNLALGGGDGAAGNASGSVLIVPGKGAGFTGNISLGKSTTPIFNGLQRGIYIADADAGASSAPVGGSYVYGFTGAGIARSPSDTFTTLWAA